MFKILDFPPTRDNLNLGESQFALKKREGGTTPNSLGITTYYISNSSKKLIQ